LLWKQAKLGIFEPIGFEVYTTLRLIDNLISLNKILAGKS